jgi:hypothetical protein
MGKRASSLQQLTDLMSYEGASVGGLNDRSQRRGQTVRRKSMTLMRKFALRMTATILVLGVTAWSASAQTQQPGASSLRTQLKNATPIETVACTAPDAHCPTGAQWVCTPYGLRCYCTPC